ncbi:hypothetical protein NDU88_005502 [Pleurodeles waltl]|uniref:Uncharacterized protein n=1 Tax=Pleurodeles waltl TaxID=8319 RepID=A0AAV7UKB7_PLEWA|nr:hypothetical protein NDU88_005502 [Pleurodeles waltl]
MHCHQGAADREDDTGAADEDWLLSRSVGGTTKSAPPRSLYDFRIKSRVKQNAECREEEDSERTRSAQEGARGKNDREEPDIEGRSDPQKARASGGVERKQRREQMSNPNNVPGETWLSKVWNLLGEEGKREEGRKGEGKDTEPNKVACKGTQFTLGLVLQKH